MAAEKADSKMIVIPVAFLFLRVWGTTRFLIDVIKVPEGHDQLPGYKPLMYLQVRDLEDDCILNSGVSRLL